MTLRRRMLSICVCFLACLPTGIAVGAGPANFVFCCRADNDLYRVMGGEKSGHQRVETASEAVRAAAEEAGVLILADGYPEKTTTVDAAVFDLAVKKKLRLYVEYPSSLPDLTVGQPNETKLERGVVASDFFGESLRPMRIVMLNGCRYVPVSPAPQKPHLVLARVAGVDTAVFGLDKTATQRILFDHPRGDLLVATTKLSHFVTGRYMPHEAWRSVWRAILVRLQPGAEVAKLDWAPSVGPSYGRDERLPADVEAEALRRSADWIVGSRVLRHPDWPKQALDWALTYNTVRAMPSADWPIGDGSLGTIEGYSSTIHADGSQPMRYAMRNDNACEVAMLMALDATVSKRPQHAKIADNLVDFILLKSGLAAGNRADPASPEYGLVGWSFDLPTYYWTDDAGRAMLGMLAVSALQKDGRAGGVSRWSEALTRDVLANFRTTGAYGFRQDCIHAEDLQKNGWRHYWTAKNTLYAPHYVGWVWPCYFWAYDKTGFKPFLARSETAIRMLMAAYPKGWSWTDRSGSIERARALLPLAWLVRAQDTAEHRAWLRRVATDLIALQDESGAIREVIGDGGQGTLSNAEYGTCETSLIQTNGDPVADMLYTCNFAIIGLHEAAAATGEPLYAEAEEKLARFLCRIQARSQAHPELDGAWYRAFNFRDWDYWASNADWEWGPWCTETGWTQPWIAGTLALRQMKTSLWGLAKGVPVSRDFDRLRRQMLPDDALGQ